MKSANLVNLYIHCIAGTMPGLEISIIMPFAFSLILLFKTYHVNVHLQTKPSLSQIV